MSGGGHGGGRGGRRRGGHAEEHENHERWLVTYADMLTLLFVLFVVLYAISSVNISKFQELKTGLSSAFNGGTSPSVLSSGNGIMPGQPQAQPVPVGPKGPDFTGKASKSAPTPAAKAEGDQFSKIKAAIDAALKARGLAGDALYTVNERGLVVTVLTNDVVFAGDSPQLLSTGTTILDAVMPSLNAVDNQIEVDGHTNQLQSAVDGWKLSTERAVAVLEYLVAHGHVAPSRLSATGHSEYVPLVPVANPNAANLNRRVDIVVQSKFPAADRTSLFTPSAVPTSPTEHAATEHSATK